MWTQEQIETLKKLHAKGIFYSDMEKEIGKRGQAITYRARLLGLKPHSHLKGKWNIKHAHLREPVMRYFMTHSWEETRLKFELTPSELKSLFTIGYHTEALQHLRKDTRVHSSWSHKKTIQMLRYSGIRDRRWVAKKLKRTSKDSYHSVKEHLSRLRISSRYVNGIPLRWFRAIASDVTPWSIKTKAGPTGKGVDFRPILVPWVECWRLCKRKKSVHPAFRASFQAMAVFQRWIHYGVSDKTIKRRMRGYLNEE